MRRGVLGLALLLAAVVGGGWLALAAAGQDAPRPSADPAPGATAEPGLPPLPALRPQVVQPQAGGSAPAAPEPPPVADSGLTGADPAPSGPATVGTRPRGELGGRGSVTEASALPNGIAVPPLEAPDAVRRMIEAGNVIARAPYLWGGGHGRWIDRGYDCSGSVSFVLAAAGYLQGPLDSGRLARWGEPGRGRWVTIYANAGHVFMEVAGIRFDTSGQRVTGSRWQNEGRPTAGFAVRHPPGL